MVRKEAQASGAPRIAHAQQQDEEEGHSLPNVWEVLQQDALLHVPEELPSPVWRGRVDKVSEQLSQLRDNGSDYAKAILDVYDTVAPGARTLTPEQFYRFRSDFEELSIEEIGEGKRQLLQEMKLLRKNAREFQR